MSQSIISAIASQLNDCFPYPAPSGKVWQKDPDEYDPVNDVIWESEWKLVEEVKEICYNKSDKSDKSDFKEKTFLKHNQKHNQCTWGCPNAHMKEHYCYESEGGYLKWLKKYEADKLKKQRMIVANVFSPNYHICNHKTHEVCSGSPCCDLFCHEGECHYISNNGLF